ncbi:MAG: hypothetical protein WCJ01_07170 [Ignavibacteria bacterium]
MKLHCFALLFAILLAASTRAQDTTTVNARLDTVIQYQKQMQYQQEKIYNETARYKDPLKNKKYGFELNPALLLISVTNNYFAVSGGFSLFDVDRNAEIAFPFYIQNGEGGGSDKRLFVWDQDIVYRRFLGQHQDGFYISGGLRLSYVDYEGNNSGWQNTSDNRMRLGAMFGIGYRYFSSSGLYWGVSISYGSFFAEGNTVIFGTVTNGGRLIFDMELFKFGIVF